MKIHRLVFSPIEVNTYILQDESGDCAIIDCGCYDNQESYHFEEYIRTNGLNPVLLLNTHCHLDHLFGNKFMLERYGLRSFWGREDEINRESAVAHAGLFGLTMEYPPDPAGYISDNQKFSFGTTELEALYVPGHAPGSYSFYCSREECVFTGDALFSGSIGRTDLPGGDYDTLISSIKERLFTLPPSTVVYPGHGEKTDIGKEKKYNPFFR